LALQSRGRPSPPSRFFPSRFPARPKVVRFRPPPQAWAVSFPSPSTTCFLNAPSLSGTIVTRTSFNAASGPFFAPDSGSFFSPTFVLHDHSGTLDYKSPCASSWGVPRELDPVKTPSQSFATACGERAPVCPPHVARRQVCAGTGLRGTVTCSHGDGHYVSFLYVRCLLLRPSWSPATSAHRVSSTAICHPFRFFGCFFLGPPPTCGRFQLSGTVCQRTPRFFPAYKFLRDPLEWAPFFPPTHDEWFYQRVRVSHAPSLSANHRLYL